MINLIRGELYKLRRSKYFMGMMFLAIIIGVALVIQWERDRELNPAYQGVVFYGIDALSYVFCGIIYLNVFFGLFASGFIVKDFKSGGISKNFTYGYKRNQVLLSKIVVFVILSLFLEIVYVSILVIYVSSKHGLYEVSNLDAILTLVRIIVLGITYNLATICIILLIAIVTKSNMCVLISSAIFVISLLVYGYQYELHVLSYLPYIAGIKVMDRVVSEADIIRCIVSSIITFIITIGGSLLHIEYTDIK